MFQGADDDGKETEIRVGRRCGVLVAAGVHLDREEFFHVCEGVEGEEIRRRRHGAGVRNWAPRHRFDFRVGFCRRAKNESKKPRHTPSTSRTDEDDDWTSRTAEAEGRTTHQFLKGYFFLLNNKHLTINSLSISSICIY